MELTGGFTEDRGSPHRSERIQRKLIEVRRRSQKPDGDHRGQEELEEATQRSQRSE